MTLLPLRGICCLRRVELWRTWLLRVTSEHAEDVTLVFSPRREKWNQRTDQSLPQATAFYTLPHPLVSVCISLIHCFALLYLIFSVLQYMFIQPLQYGISLSLSLSLCINGVMTLVFIPFPHICFFIPALHMSCPLKPKVKCPPSPYLPTVTIKCFIHQSFPWWHISAYSFVQCSQPLRTRREVLRSPTCSKNI